MNFTFSYMMYESSGSVVKLMRRHSGSSEYILEFKFDFFSFHCVMKLVGAAKIPQSANQILSPIFILY